ncbi:MAG: hypothetical protein HQL41_16925 [Alphaproteobacteria bacterium]|nr:hypothetical protein [Alphaproteobacteria bacterium]
MSLQTKDDAISKGLEPFRLLRVITKDAANFSAMVFAISILSSYSYNVMYFHNIDNNVFPQSFLPLLNSSDYMSSSFLFLPMIVIAFFLVWFSAFVTSRALAQITSSFTSKRADSGVRKWTQWYRAHPTIYASLRIIKPVYQLIEKMFVLGKGYEFWRKFFYTVPLLAACLVFIPVCVLSTSIHTRYNYLMLTISAAFLLLMWARKAKIFRNYNTRDFYSSFVTVVFAALISGTLGNYMFDLSVIKTKRSLQLSIGSGVRENVPETVANRALDRGLFYSLLAIRCG